MHATSVLRKASSSPISTSQTPCKSSEASLPSKVRMLSLNQPRLILSSRVLLPMPWGPARMSMLSYLLPGTMARVTAAVKALRVTALV